MKWKFGKSYKLCYFQVRESPAPLNIPTPTPAPDQAGPVACLRGPVGITDYERHVLPRRVSIIP